MNDHPIKVSFIGSLVNAVPNPLPERNEPPPRDIVRPQDTVTWSFVSAPGSRVEVVFVAIRDLPQGVSQPISNPLGPCSSISPVGQGQIVGTIDITVPTDSRQARRFFYKMLVNGVPIPWDNPVEDDLIDGGGIDIPRTPP